MGRADVEYARVLREILDRGADRGDRTGTGTRSLFGLQMRFDLGAEFPLLTGKRVHFKSVAEELFWFLRGESNVTSLQERGVTIWNEWADQNGDLGPVYGVQWRSWPTADGGEIDQVKGVIESLIEDPESRRHIVSAWNVGEVEKMALPPCHVMFQFYVADGRLSCHIYQRSADMFLGVPFNIASYALLTHIIAEQVGLDVGELVWTGGDCHIYDNHRDQVVEYLSREAPAGPSVRVRGDVEIEEYSLSDIELVGYEPLATIRAQVAV